MSVEIIVAGDGLDLERKSKENRSVDGNQSAGDGHMIMNGISNGYTEKHVKKEHKSEHKDKHRDKDKHKDRHKEHKDKEKHKDKDKQSSSGKEDKHHSSSSSIKDKEREKEKKHKDEKKDKEREHKSTSSSKDKEHKSSSSSKDKHNSCSSSLSKDKDKHSSSSSSHKHSSSRDKYSSTGSSRDKEKHGSGSDRDKHSSSSSDRKHKDKSKDRDRNKVKSKEGEGHRDKKDKSEKTAKIKVEFGEEDKHQHVSSQSVEFIKEEPMDCSERLQPCVNSFHDQSPLNIKSETSRNIKSEEDTEEDIPLASRSGIEKVKRGWEDSDEDDVPLMARKKIKKESKKRKEESDEEDFRPMKKKKSTKKGTVNEEMTPQSSPKKKKKEDEQQEVWKWWEEEKKDGATKWNFLEHKGPVFAPPYERLPPDVKFFYDGKEMTLSELAEEVASFYAQMLSHDYTTKEAFNKNFFKDWRKVMTEKEKEKITDLSKCNFKHMHKYFVARTEERKAMSKEEKKKIKEQNEEIVKTYGFCVIDGHKERIGNFKIEPPGLFRGRGEHPKMGMLKRRVQPEDVIINCSKDSKIPKPPEGHKWKEVRHDKNVTWLASWTENVQGQVKYVMLNPSSKLKGEKDWQKYETARKLAKCIGKIRQEYQDDFKSKEMRIRQRAVALYFIDKLALRAGNEKDEDQADTVGCCSLRVEHISLHEQKDGKDYVVVFDFLGKDSIRYYNEVCVEKRVFKNLQLFMQNKSTGDDLFDRLNTTVLNKHLNELMEGLTAKVFRTFNASITLQEQLDKMTDPNCTLQEKILVYNRANRAVAILCNHQRAVPKTHAKSMENLKAKIDAKKEMVQDAERQYKDAKHEHKRNGSAKNKIDMEKRKKALERLREQLAKLELQATDREENKEIALSTSKLNYLDPRISVAWCKKNNVPIEKIYNKTQRDKFRWAIDMAGPDYVF
ncbi:DNA topoisomerase 1 [Cryptotermes secundus]|uniref:DNA topoisomerase I n=1 Tax=Cryptotermes secundus TaxID=105785 RepID=A0A2J7Q1L0_9NEOP|nr:DNA topoisomerase I, mitochondrial [Cryptotermes secundus]PNF22470.1 DNA topoisomerase 1 [Cryptotermes secundus]